MRKAQSLVMSQLADSAWFPHRQILLEFWHMLIQSKKFST